MNLSIVLIYFLIKLICFNFVAHSRYLHCLYAEFLDHFKRNQTDFVRRGPDTTQQNQDSSQR